MSIMFMKDSQIGPLPQEDMEKSVKAHQHSGRSASEKKSCRKHNSQNRVCSDYSVIKQGDKEISNGLSHCKHRTREKYSHVIDRTPYELESRNWHKFLGQPRCTQAVHHDVLAKCDDVGWMACDIRNCNNGFAIYNTSWMNCVRRD